MGMGTADTSGGRPDEGKTTEATGSPRVEDSEGKKIAIIARSISARTLFYATYQHAKYKYTKNVYNNIMTNVRLTESMSIPFADSSKWTRKRTGGVQDAMNQRTQTRYQACVWIAGA